VDFDISAGYSPQLTLYGNLFDVFDNTIYPLGGFVRFSMVPIKQSWGYIGFEIAPFWNRLRDDFNSYTVLTHLTLVHLNGIYQYWFPRRVLVLNLRVGGGITMALDYYFEQSGKARSKGVNSLMASLNLGLSLRWFIRKPLYMELGVDYNHVFRPVKPQPGYARPALGLGWQF
jgi:hypothetical protein